jgi:chromosome segregation ATPase
MLLRGTLVVRAVNYRETKVEHKLSIRVISFLYELASVLNNNGKHKVPNLFIIMLEDTIRYVENLVSHEAALYRNVEQYRKEIAKLTESLSALSGQYKVAVEECNNAKQALTESKEETETVRDFWKDCKASFDKLEQAFHNQLNENMDLKQKLESLEGEHSILLTANLKLAQDFKNILGAKK